MKKITITTVYKGLNYGSSLQAYASKVYFRKLGYDSEIIGYKDGLIKGRDIRVKKLIMMFLRTFWRPALLKKTMLTYGKSITKNISQEDKDAFLKFNNDKLKVKKFSWTGLKKYAKSNAIEACICGSDQIWNATNIYIDPIYYLKFAPKEKRIAYAPSFGKNEIPEYNRKIIKKNILEFNHISVREEEGVKIINELIDREVPALIDPTLLLDKDDWINLCKNFENKQIDRYILLYFLDSPSEIAVSYVKYLCNFYKCKVISIPCLHNKFEELDNIIIKCGIGPSEFVNLIINATFVCTDSFHGTAFSVNLNIPFFTFKRNYGAATDQSSRITTLLNKLELQDRFIYDKELNIKINLNKNINFNNSNRLLNIEREKSKKYILDSIQSISK